MYYSLFKYFKVILCCLVLACVIFFAYKKYFAIQEEQETDIAKEATNVDKIRAENEKGKALLAKQKEEKATALSAAQELKRKKKEARSLGVSLEMLPLAQLNAIKQQLADGERPVSKMPDTVFKLTEEKRILMFVLTPMSWDEADEWAHEYGGYIAVARNNSDLQDLAEKIPENLESVWLGGSNATLKWSWIDGSEMDDSFTLPTSNNREFVTLTKSGKLDSDESREKRPFFIEWLGNGENPASLKHRLTRDIKTLSTATENKRYFIVDRLVSREEAHNLAASVDGRLVSISNAEENKNLNDFLQVSGTRHELFWTGAVKNEYLWSWQSGEAWNIYDWLDNGKGEGDFALVKIGEKAQLVPAERDEYHCFIIEWGEEHQSTQTKEIKFKLSNLISMKQKAATIISEIEKTKEEEYSSNVRTLLADLRSLKRSLESNSTTIRNARGLDLLLHELNNATRVPNKFKSIIRSQKARDYISTAKKKQSRIDTSVSPVLANTRRAYLQHINKAITEMQSIGQIDMVDYLEKEVQNIGQKPEDFSAYINKSTN